MSSTIELFIIIYSCLNLFMYSIKILFLVCRLVFIILARDSVNYRYGYVVRIWSCIDWSIAFIRFKGLLRILSHWGFYLILVCILCWQNSLNITAYALFLFSTNFFPLVPHDSQFVYSTLLWNNCFLMPPWLVMLFSQYVCCNLYGICETVNPLNFLLVRLFR